MKNITKCAMVAHQATETEDGKTEIIVKDPFDKQLKSMIFDCTLEQFLSGKRQYEMGALMQDAFSFLSADEREFLISGTTPEEWESTFGKEDDDEYESQEIFGKLPKAEAKNIISKLILIANKLDQNGLYKEADEIDGILKIF